MSISVTPRVESAETRGLHGAAVVDRPVHDRPRELAVVRDADFGVETQRGGMRRQELVNRAFNIVIAATILLVLAPLLIVVSLAIKLTSAGPILYRQARVGLDRRRRHVAGMPYDRRARDLGGQAFRIYKFRSMYVDAEQKTGAVWAIKGDPRVTPIGRFMRACRIDEVPQLVNVIKGDMNIVGPRPERPSIFARLREGIPRYPERQRARPGITGWAQINQNYDACLDDVRKKVEFDLEYIRAQSVAHDLRILARTVPFVLFRRAGW